MKITFRFNCDSGAEETIKSCGGGVDTMISSCTQSSLSNGSQPSVLSMLDEMSLAVCPSEVSSSPISGDSCYKGAIKLL